jgi:hypothetical protein
MSLRTWSGRYIDLANPQPADIDVNDIAHALAKICRFGGHIEDFYSVAEHSIHCCRVADEVFGYDCETQLQCLLHDAAEAYLGDVCRPLKAFLGEAYRSIELRFEQVIGEALNCPIGTHADRVRHIDNALLFAERRHLMVRDGVEWHGEREAVFLSTVHLACYEPPVSAAIFLSLYETLQRKRANR